MLGKPGISKKNLWVIPATTFFSSLTGATALQIMTYILSDPDYYDLSSDKANQVSANSFTLG
jgi:hypothetical protein